MSASDLQHIFRAAVAAVEPRAAVVRALAVDGRTLRAGDFARDLTSFSRILVVGAGKAAAGMAAGVEEVLGRRVDRGLVVVKDGHTGPHGRVAQVEAGHPIPDERGARATARVLDLVRSADGRTLVICVLSGGASALLVAPAPGLTLEDKAAATSLLLASGADIAGVNTVRKHLSAVKGGRLAAAAAPARVLSFVLSDVIGDRLDVIASGPTFPDPSTFGDARRELERWGLFERVPPAVRAHLERGALGLIPETPKPGDPIFGGVGHCVVGGNRIALDAAAADARALGYEAVVLSTAVSGEARDAARWLANEARTAMNGLGRDGRPKCLLAGGETTVTVTGSGVGGRNQECALACALEIDGLAGVTLLCAGTDGTDGPTDAAGAFVDGGTASLARSVGLDPAASLENNDSYRFFEELGRRTGTSPLFVPGPTGTNVMDVLAVCVVPPGGSR